MEGGGHMSAAQRARLRRAPAARSRHAGDSSAAGAAGVGALVTIVTPRPVACLTYHYLSQSCVVYIELWRNRLQVRSVMIVPASLRRLSRMLRQFDDSSDSAGRITDFVPRA